MKIRHLVISAAIMTMFGAAAARADWDDNDRYQNRHWAEHHDNDHHDNGHHEHHHWSRGERLPHEYWGPRYEVRDWHAYHLHEPPRGYHWVRDDDDNFVLAAVATGIIAEVLINQH